MKFLSEIELAARGMRAGLKARYENEDGKDFDMMAFVYCDRNRYYFITTCSNLSSGQPVQRIRWRQVADVETDEEPERLKLTVEVPVCSEIYYKTCGAIDAHNRCRQDTLNLEKKLETKHWDRRVNMSLFAMMVVDSWMLYKGCTGGSKLSQREYYKELITYLVDNDYEKGVRSRKRAAEDDASSCWSEGSGRSGVGLHLTPTKRMKPVKIGESKRFFQVRCKSCNKKTIMRCSLCVRDPAKGDQLSAFCCATSGRGCFQEHMYNEHKCEMPI